MADLMTEVEFAGRKVVVPVGGYYDRFRSNPDLDEVARDPEAGNIDFFRRMPKQKVETRIGPTWAPNFYYRSSSIQLLFLAPIDRLRAMLPEPLEPLRALPGYGLVALTIFAYRVCDNDPYNEVSVAVVVRRPDARGSHAVELMQSMRACANAGSSACSRFRKSPFAFSSRPTARMNETCLSDCVRRSGRQIPAGFHWAAAPRGTAASEATRLRFQSSDRPHQP